MALKLQAFLFFLAVPLNLIWEVAQISAYEFPPGTLMTNILGCFIPSLGDGLMILIIYWLGWAIFKRAEWILKPGLKGYAAMVTTGFILAVIVEWNALYRTGAWSYNEGMLVLPILGVGLSPILQMLVLSPATALLLRWTWKNQSQTV